MDQKDKAIILSVATRWADGRAATMREVAKDVGLGITTVYVRITGIGRVGPGLLEYGEGWLTMDERPYMARTLVPGKRFGGMQRLSGRIYERLEAGHEADD
jgi:hypothetical protein